MVHHFRPFFRLPVIAIGGLRVSISDHMRPVRADKSVEIFFDLDFVPAINRLYKRHIIALIQPANHVRIGVGLGTDVDEFFGQNRQGARRLPL